MKNLREAGAYVFSQIVDTLWIAKTTLKSFPKMTNGGRTDSRTSRQLGTFFPRDTSIHRKTNRPLIQEVKIQHGLEKMGFLVLHLSLEV